MKKFGFTLAELIITLSIIGVVAALVAPQVTNIIPDTEKAKILKYNTQLNNIITEMFNDRTLYNPTPDGNGGWNCEGLACIDNSLVNSTIADELISRLNLENGRNPEGSLFDIIRLPQADGTIRCLVTIDTAPDEDGCQYSNNCNQPRDVDTFSLEIDESGNVIPGDALTAAYLSNPQQMNNRRADYDRARELLPDFQ